MASPEPGASASTRPLDAMALQRVMRRMQQASSPPWLHGEVARRMAERLPIVKLQPARIVDWGHYLGASAKPLQRAYPQAQLLAVERDAARRDASAALLQTPWWSPRRWSGTAPMALSEAEVQDGQGELLWANMALQGVADPQAVMVQWQRALAVDGFLMFSTLGPGSLTLLRDLYADQGWLAPFAPFVDMHDLGDMLLHAGFADPVMDQEQITLSYTSAEALLVELRTLGGNVAAQRAPGLRTPRWRERLVRRLESRADAQGRIALGFELVYGHAFKPPPRPRLAAETSVPLEDLRAMVRSGRRGTGPAP